MKAVPSYPTIKRNLLFLRFFIFLFLIYNFVHHVCFFVCVWLSALLCRGGHLTSHGFCDAGAHLVNVFVCVLCVVITLWGHVCVRRPYSQVVSPRLLIWSELEPNMEAPWRTSVVEGEDTKQPSPLPVSLSLSSLSISYSHPSRPAHTVSPMICIWEAGIFTHRAQWPLSLCVFIHRWVEPLVSLMFIDVLDVFPSTTREIFFLPYFYLFWIILYS